MYFSKFELRDLIKSWLAISLAFTIASVGMSYTFNFLLTLLVSALTAGLGFLAHEIAHKFVAQRYHCLAEYKSFDNMLILAIALSFFGMVFAAPGAVFITGNVSNKKKGIIALAGPLTNLIISFVFFVFFFSQFPLIKMIAISGFVINTWLALFNLLPFGNFDGRKILSWNKIVYISTIAIVGFATIFQDMLLT